MSEKVKTKARIRPPAALGKVQEEISAPRRSIISWIAVGWLAFVAATGGFFTMIVRFLFPNVLFEPPQTFKIGFPDDFSKNAVDIKFKKQYNACNYIVIHTRLYQVYITFLYCLITCLRLTLRYLIIL